MASLSSGEVSVDEFLDLLDAEVARFGAVYAASMATERRAD
jgi:hypothetical protein